jgi:hypothetical protein
MMNLPRILPLIYPVSVPDISSESKLLKPSRYHSVGIFLLLHGLVIKFNAIIVPCRTNIGKSYKSQKLDTYGIVPIAELREKLDFPGQILIFGKCS